MSIPLFVYGSLLRGLEHADVLPSGPRIPARTQGQLYALPGDRYPTLVAGPGWVVGELVDLTEPDRLLSRLDDFESVASGLYERARRRVHPVPTLSPVTAWVYLCPAARARAVAAAGTPIPSGDWRRHLGGSAR